MMRLSLLLGVLAVSACAVPAPAPLPFPPVPPPQTEVIPNPPVSEARLIWGPGHWEWAGNDYRWQPGAWIQRPPGATMWQPGTWSNASGAWAWVPGHWI